MDEDNLVDYQDFINLYRLYVLCLSKQPEFTTHGTVNIRLDFELNESTPQIILQLFMLYLSILDIMFILKSDGTKQYVVQ